MKLILTQEVAGLGGPGDIVEVKDGYARNFLVPRGYGMKWTRGGEKQVAAIRKARASREIATLEEAQHVKATLENASVRIDARAGGTGRLFGAVTPADVAEALKAATGRAVDRRKVEIGRPIKTLGSYQVQVRLHADVQASVDVEVVQAS